MTTSTRYIENPAESMTNSSLDPSANPAGQPEPSASLNPEARFAPDPMARDAFRPAANAGPNGFDRSQAQAGAPVGPATMVQNLLKNKILIGLVLVFGFIFTVGQFYTSNESNIAAQKVAAVASAPQALGPRTERPAQQTIAPTGLTPDMAQKFVAWWIGRSMDYRAATATNSHNEAFAWMTPQAVKAFKESLWSPQIAAGITQGQVSAAFQAVSVQPQAINPDGSIVVTVLGTLIIQEANNPTPASQQIVVDFLVKKDAAGYRIAGLYNRTSR
jgi:hypothetical protein